jgi:hypothetical protein
MVLNVHEVSEWFRSEAMEMGIRPGICRSTTAGVDLFTIAKAACFQG